MVASVLELDELLATPSAALVRDLAALDGDIVVVGAAGKMGPTVAALARRASDRTGDRRRVIAVSRFSDGSVRSKLDEAGIETVAMDVLDPACLAALPDAANVVYMVGAKFGTTGGGEPMTWATNAYLSGRVAERYPTSRIVVFSSGNVYPLTPVSDGGATEDTRPDPIGEYAQSALARERIFEFFSRRNRTPMILFRLNYAIDLRYGVLLDVARSVYADEPIDLTMGFVNVIWQGDASEYALRALTLADTPPAMLNVTGPEIVAVRWLAMEFAARFGRTPKFIGTESPTALLSDATRAFSRFGRPRVTLSQMIDWVASWIVTGGPVLGKPTHFQEREGRF